MGISGLLILGNRYFPKVCGYNSQIKCYDCFVVFSLMTAEVLVWFKKSLNMPMKLCEIFPESFEMNKDLETIGHCYKTLYIWALEKVTNVTKYVNKYGLQGSKSDWCRNAVGNLVYLDVLATWGNIFGHNNIPVTCASLNLVKHQYKVYLIIYSIYLKLCQPSL